MFRIRRIYDDTLPINKEAIIQVQQILRTQFAELKEADITKLPEYLHNPAKYQFRSILLVAEDAKAHIKGFALLHHAADLRFSFLDYISAARQSTGRGIGGALYEKVREIAQQFKVIGLFFECLPDEPRSCRPEFLAQNAARLRFYERFGAHPIIGTAYETPVKPGDSCVPLLVFDDLGQNTVLSRDQARSIVRAILERKYGHFCPPEYIQMVVDSFQDDPVKIRPPRYIKTQQPIPPVPRGINILRIALTVNEKHEIHHMHDRGYVESPVRVKSILKEIMPTGLFEQVPVQHYSEKHITAVHETGFVNYLKTVCLNVPPNKSVYPYVFPIRNATRPPKELPIRAGYYCIDTFTPLNHNAFIAAKRAVDCTLSSADRILSGYSISYALVRPPGHHAERRAFGGFCYFNSASIAAHYLSRYGKVCILDIDYHHGNGHQDIFYRRSDVLTISLHGHPRFAYPYFSGFADETGEDEGKGYNLNFPLPEELDGTQYREVLMKALRRIERYQAQFLIVALGLDTAKGDPTGTWMLKARDFNENGQLIGALGLPTLVVQEGGYAVRSLGINARHFLTGLWQGFHEHYSGTRKEVSGNGKK